MSNYPNSSPFGPHGPQTNGYSTTPNPTAQSSFANIGGGSTSYRTANYSGAPGATGTVNWNSGPIRKSVIFALILSCFLGPIGVMYATSGTRRFRWALVWLIGSLAATIAFRLSYTPFMIASIIWAVIAARSYNKSL